MTKKERVLAVMKKEQVDMIPAGFWFHYKSDYTVQQMIDEHMKLFRTTDMDIIKIMQDYPYPISGKITCADDWYHIQVKGTDSEEFAKMAEIIRGIRKEAGKDVLIFQTMFGPFKAASMTFGDDVLMKYSKEAPEAVAAGVKIIADALEEWTKGYLEAGKNFFALPSKLNLENYIELFTNSNYWIFLKNSFKITVITIILILIFVPSVSYSIARNFNRKYYKTIYFYIMMGLFVPSQVVLLPVTKMMSKLNMLNHAGLIILYVAFSLTQGVFLFVNYIRGLPYEIEESAQIDGCSVFQTYVKIVLPLVKPMISTLLIMDTLWIWNDFMLPLLILNRSQAIWTLPLFQYNFKTEYSFNYTMAFTAYLLAMLPMLIIYCMGQKYIVKGLTAGSVKG